MLALTSFLLGFLIFTTTKNKWLTVVSAFVYIYLTFAFEGNTVWFESALAPIFLLSFILMKKTLEEAESKNFFYLGGLLAVVLLIKQTSLYLLPVYALFFLYLFFRRKLTLQRVTLFIAPAASLLLLFAFYLHSLDLWPHFYRWAVEFVFLLPSLSTADVPPDLLLPSKKQLLLILLIVFVGIYALWQTRKFATLLALSFLIFSILFIFPRFAYFHLLIALPFFIILISELLHKSKNIMSFALVLIFTGLTIPVFRGTVASGNRFLNPEVLEVASYLQNSHPDSSIFSLNGPDLVYFLIRKPPAVRPWVDQLPWEMIFFGDQNFLQAFKKGDPDLVIFRPYLQRAVDGLGAYQPKLVVDYVFGHYTPIKKFEAGTIILKKI